MTFEELQKANESIKTMPISRQDKKTGKTTTKEYAEVNQRIKALRMIHPTASIITELLHDDGERCLFKATVMFGDLIIGTGTAFEEKASSYINKTSYIENCETSAVGRALAMCGIGIDVSIASYEEVANAINNQDKEPTAEMKKDAALEVGKLKLEVIKHLASHTEAYRENVLQNYGVKSTNELTAENCKDFYDRFIKEGAKNE